MKQLKKKQRKKRERKKYKYTTQGKKDIQGVLRFNVNVFFGKKAIWFVYKQEIRLCKKLQHTSIMGNNANLKYPLGIYPSVASTMR